MVCVILAVLDDGMVICVNGRTNVISSVMNNILVVPLNPPSDLYTQLKTNVIELSWTDPLDKYADELGNVTDEGDQLVSQWAFSKVVRKVGSLPTAPNDGETICISTSRNEYQTTRYIDTISTFGVTYYYAVYACNTAGVYSEAAVSQGYTPMEYDPILGNNSWDIIDDACSKGLAQGLWEIGDEIDIVAMNETLTAVILDFDHDDLADGTGKAAITFGLKELMSFLNPLAFDGNTFYGSTSGMRGWYDNTLYPGIEDSLRSKLVEVTKVSILQTWRVTVNDYNGGTMISSSATYNSQSSGNVYVFPFASAELTTITSSNYGRYDAGLWYEGTLYPYYSTQSNWKKSLSNGTGSDYNWHLRAFTVTTGDMSGNDIYYSSEYGGNVTLQRSRAANMYGICFGFCVGKSAA